MGFDVVLTSQWGREFRADCDAVVNWSPAISEPSGLNGAANSARTATLKEGDTVIGFGVVSMGPRIPRGLRRVERSSFIPCAQGGLNGAANSARTATGYW